jgi:hypothetical protein
MKLLKYSSHKGYSFLTRLREVETPENQVIIRFPFMKVLLD